MPETDRHRGIIFALICLLLLGIMPLLVVARPAGSGGLVFAVGLTLWQLAFALPLTLAEARRGVWPGLQPANGRAAGAVLGISLLTGALFGLSTLLYILAADRAGPVTMAITLQAYPFIAMALEALIHKRRRSITELGLALIMALALVGLVTGGRFHPGALSPWALASLAVPLIWAVAHLILRHVLRHLPVTPNQVTVSRLVISGAVLLVAVALVGQGKALLAALGDAGFRRAAAVMGLAYYLELIFWFHAMRHIEVSQASMITVPAPALTMAIGAMVLGVPVAPFQILSMLVISAALLTLLRMGAQD